MHLLACIHRPFPTCLPTPPPLRRSFAGGPSGYKGPTTPCVEANVSLPEALAGMEMSFDNSEFSYGGKSVPCEGGQQTWEGCARTFSLPLGGWGPAGAQQGSCKQRLSGMPRLARSARRVFFFPSSPLLSR